MCHWQPVEVRHGNGLNWLALLTPKRGTFTNPKILTAIATCEATDSGNLLNQSFHVHHKFPVHNA